MKIAMPNHIQGDQPAKALIERGIFGAANFSLLVIYSYSTFTVRTSVVSNIGLEDPTGLKSKIYVQYLRGSRTEEDMVYFRPVRIIP